MLWATDSSETEADLPKAESELKRMVGGRREHTMCLYEGKSNRLPEEKVYAGLSRATSGCHYTVLDKKGHRVKEPCHEEKTMCPHQSSTP